MLGNPDARSAAMFIDDLKSRLAGRVQLTTDGRTLVNRKKTAAGARAPAAVENHTPLGELSYQVNFAPKSKCLGWLHCPVTSPKEPLPIAVFGVQ